MSKLHWNYEKRMVFKTHGGSNLFEAKLYLSAFSTECVNWKRQVEEIILYPGAKRANVQIQNIYQNMIGIVFLCIFNVFCIKHSK